MRKITLLILLFIFVVSYSYGQSQASYTVTFTSNWTQTAHPHSSGNLPSNAHWSKLVGATHNSDVVFLEMGEVASQGVENIAEQGSNGVFFSEVDAAITAGDAYYLVDGSGLATAEGQIIISDIEVNEDFPLLTLLSMIAPSPDWMIAVNSVNLLDGNSDWIDQIDIDLYPYDAGTDSGVDYTSPNNDTDPQEPISSLQGVTPFSNETIGSFSIVLQSVLGVEDAGQNEIVIYPNPASKIVTISDDSPLQTVTFYNVLGAEVLKISNINATSKQIDISELSSGIYLVKAQNELNNESVKRLVKL